MFLFFYFFQIMKLGGRLIHGNLQNLRIFHQNKDVDLYTRVYTVITLIPNQIEKN